MASMAVDILDLHWRLLQGQEKPCTRKGWRRLRCNLRRARGDRCHHREKRGEDRRIAVLARTRSGDSEQQLEEMVADEEPAARPLLIGYSQNSYQYEEERFREEEEEIQLVAIANGYRERARAIRLIGCPSYFQDQVSALELDPEIGNLSTALFIEEFERETFQGFAA